MSIITVDISEVRPKHSAWLNWMMGFAFPMYASTAQWHTSVLRILSSINLQFVCLVTTVSRINACTFTTRIRTSSGTEFILFICFQIFGRTGRIFVYWESCTADRTSSSPAHKYPMISRSVLKPHSPPQFCPGYLSCLEFPQIPAGTIERNTRNLHCSALKCAA